MSTQDPNVATDDGDDDDGDDVTTTAPTAAATSLLTVPTASASASVSIPGASVGTVGITVLPGGSTTTVTLATATGGAAVTRTVTGITAPTATNGTSTNGTSTDSGSGGGGLSQSAKIAIGVSVPLGILLLLLLTLGAYRMGSRGRHGGGGIISGLFGRRSRSGATASGSPKALVPSAANDDDDAEKAMLAEKNATQPRGPVELATGPDVPELPTAVNYQELAAGDPWEAKRALEAQQVGGYRGNAADDDDDQTPRSREMLGGAGVLAGGGAARQVNYGVNMNRKPVAGAGGAPRREGSQASSSGPLKNILEKTVEANLI
ncbi:uncharacterized protein LTHEOB_4623 [Neofusicoccum parvum]|uniref:Uncharacterized protein LTHEOB_4623 n=1 Tax=Neofusicoccum parvum TaxID=310453 RepID=A0ACB5S3Q9_9PEZI|nr:uncharacterized protein LTHEOB_4623 [Neofusicoccum parvum]